MYPLSARQVVGSSPRVWGQAVALNGTANIGRIIPTRVGTRTMFLALNITMKDHPHACGDKYEVSSVDVNIKGSSPRVWGQGKPLKNRGIKTQDHPHACGDKLFLVAEVFVIRGSSPRVWGQDNFTMIYKDNNRIIPTRVGTRI